MANQPLAVSAEQAAQICGCSMKEVENYRREVLPRPPGAVADPERFSVSEVVAIAAGVRMRSWPGRKAVPGFVARLALKPQGDRDWVAVYEPRRGLRFEPVGFVLKVKYVSDKAGRIFDPAPFYEVFDNLAGSVDND